MFARVNPTVAWVNLQSSFESLSCPTYRQVAGCCSSSLPRIVILMTLFPWIARLPGLPQDDMLDVGMGQAVRARMY